MNTWTIGADPEIFIGDGYNVRSIIGKIGGTKHQPRPLPQLGDGYAVQEDNVALEFNIPACSSKAGFVGAIVRATGFLEQAMRDMHGLQFDKRSAVSFPEAEMYDDKAFEFGCEPDYNAWTKQRNPRPKCSDKFLRSCGGHIHVGVKDIDPHEAVKAMDLFLSVPAQLMDMGFLRKSLYGKAGAFRRTAYGFEYRPLSNFWIFNSKLIEWAYDNTERALDYVRAGGSVDVDKDRILDAIDNNNKKQAEDLCDEYALEIVNA